MKILKILILTLLTTISIGQSFGEEKGTPEYYYKVKEHLEFLGFTKITRVANDTMIAFNNSRIFEATFAGEKLAGFTFVIRLTDYAKKNPKQLLEFLNTLNDTSNLIRQHYVYDNGINAIVMPIVGTQGYAKQSFNDYLTILDVWHNGLIEIVKNNKKFEKLIKDKSLLK